MQVLERALTDYPRLECHQDSKLQSQDAAAAALIKRKNENPQNSADNKDFAPKIGFACNKT